LRHLEWRDVKDSRAFLKKRTEKLFSYKSVALQHYARP